MKTISMHFFFAVNILLIIFTLAECDRYHNHTLKGTNSCRSVRRLASKTNNAAKCQLRPHVVELKPERGYEFDPPIVSINKCAGSCVRKVCVPTKFQTVQRIVRRMERGNIKATTCAVLELEEHADCECQCTMQPKDCHSEQEYDNSNCSCKCKDTEMKKAKCEEKKGMMWFEEMCDCICGMLVQKCTNGQTWNRKTCECE